MPDLKSYWLFGAGKMAQSFCDNYDYKKGEILGIIDNQPNNREKIGGINVYSYNDFLGLFHQEKIIITCKKIESVLSIYLQLLCDQKGLYVQGVYSSNGKIEPIECYLLKGRRVLETKISMLNSITQGELLFSEQLIDQRLAEKKKFGKKIVVVFLCCREQVWGAQKSIYEALCNDSSFDVKLVVFSPDSTVWGREKQINNKIWEDYNCHENYYSGYDADSNRWLDLRTLHPDYVFYQLPYDSLYPQQYRSCFVSRYAKICYVAYGFEMTEGLIIETSHPVDFFQNVSFYFAQDSFDWEYIKRYLERNNNFYTRNVITGYPKFDGIRLNNKIGTKTADRFLWCPRWNEEDGSGHFYDYGDRLADLFTNKSEIKLSFRPHPLMWENFQAGKGKDDSPMQVTMNRFISSDSLSIDTKADYHDVFEWSDCLIADITSLMGDYFLTGKPIIYCHKTDCFSDAGRRLSEGFYWVRNWEELKNTIEMLASGEDPLFEKRQKIIKEHYYLPEGGAGMKIKEFIKADALK